MTKHADTLHELSKKLPKEKLLQAKKFGFSDIQLAHIFGVSQHEIRALRERHGVKPVYKTVVKEKEGCDLRRRTEPHRTRH